MKKKIYMHLLNCDLFVKLNDFLHTRSQVFYLFIFANENQMVRALFRSVSGMAKSAFSQSKALCMKT